MSKIKIGIVEDEVTVADNITETLLNLGYETATPCITYTQAITMIEEEEPDLVILDIQLAGKKTGLDVAEKINETFDIPFIILTANSDKETVEKAKLVHPNAFLVKPFNKEELYTAIEIALANFERSKQSLLNTTDASYLKNFIFIKQKDVFHKLEFNDIVYIKNDHIYVEVHTKDEKKFVVRSSLEGFYNKLLSNYFIQIHRRYIINLNYLQEVQSNIVIVNNQEIPISKPFRANIIEKANIS